MSCMLRFVGMARVGALSHLPNLAVSRAGSLFSCSCRFYRGSQFGVTAARVRYDAVLMYGVMHDDDASLDRASLTALRALRDRAEEVLFERANARDDKNEAEAAASAFLSVANDAVVWMNNLPVDYRLHFPRQHSFVTGSAPLAPLWSEVLTKILDKVISKASLPAAYRSLQNGGGFAISGSRGVGKSNVLRLIVLVSAVLFPLRIVSVYVDYKCTPLKPSPRELLFDALQCCNPSRFKEGTPVPSDMQGVLDTAGNLVTLFAADEIEVIYAFEKHKDIWTDFSTLATKYCSSLMVADSGSKVVAMVKRQGYETQLLKWFSRRLVKEKGHDLPHSLTEDKVQIRSVFPLSSTTQYREYYEHADPHNSCINASRGASLSGHKRTQGDQPPGHAADIEEAIYVLHGNTGGRLRAIERGGDTLPSLPLAHSIERSVLEQLYDWQQKLAKLPPLSAPWNSFSAISASEEQVLSWISAWRTISPQSSGITDVDIHSLLESSILVRCSDGMLSFAYPAHARMLQSARGD